MLFVAFLQVVPRRSSLEAFQEIIDSAKSKEIAIFIDYDETPSPIFYDPQKAYMSSEVNRTS
jgi:trehalose 6-phosphate phosphatase